MSEQPEQFIEHTPPVRHNKGREVKRRRKQALRKVRETIQTAQVGVPLTREPVIRCRDCSRLADPYKAAKIGEVMCECPDMDETLENSANNGTKQNPESLVLANVSRETLSNRVTWRAARKLEREQEEAAQTEGRSVIEMERARLRAERG